MLRNNCQTIPFGNPIPLHTPHAISVSLPTISDVIRYKESQKEGLEKKVRGYPRNTLHPYEAEAIKIILKEKSIEKKSDVFIVTSRESGQTILDFYSLNVTLEELDGLIYFSLPSDYNRLADVKKYIQRTGTKAFSRQLEDFLVKKGVLSNPFEEDIIQKEPEKEIIKSLGQLYGTKESNIRLYSSGMNAIHSIFQVLKQIGANNGRATFISFGEIYFDTVDIIQDYSSNSISIENVHNYSWLEEVLEARGNEIAGIFTEVPTNPYLSTPDLPKLFGLAQKYNIPLVVDSTLGTPVSLNILPYCDFAVESLTKFAAGTGEVMGGALIVNPTSIFSNKANLILPELGIPIYFRDAQRLAYTIKGYQLRVSWSRNNIPRIVGFLENHPKIKKVHWSHSSENIDAYRKIEKKENAYSLVFSVELNCPLKHVYDKLKLPKGPSLGTDFTLVMPYVYLVYYDLLNTSKGKTILKLRGISPDMIRISLGCEAVEHIIGAFDEALAD